MKFEYNVGSPNGYCGVNRTLSQRNVANYTGVSRANLPSDNSGNSFTIQLRDKNNNYFEKQIMVNLRREKHLRYLSRNFIAPKLAV